MDANTTSSGGSAAAPERDFPKPDRQGELQARIAELEAAQAAYEAKMKAATEAGRTSQEVTNHFVRAQRCRRLRELYLEELFLLRHLDEVRGRQLDAAIEIHIGRKLPP